MIGYSFGASARALIASVLTPVLLSSQFSLADTVGGDVVPFTGTNLGGITQVLVGGAVAGFSANTPTTVSVTIPAVTSMTKPAHPNYNGSSHRLATALTLDDFFNAGTWSVHIVFYADAAATDAGALSRYQNPQFFTDDTFALICMGYSSAGVHVVAGSSGATELVVPCSLGVHIAQARFDGATLWLRVDGGDWVSVAASNTSSMVNALKFGANYNNTAFFDGRLIEVGFIDSSLSDANMDGILVHLGSRHKVSTIGDVSTSAIDPATLGFTGLWRAGSYIAAAIGTWAGTASSGSSGGRDLTGASNFPAASTLSWPGYHDVTVTTAQGTSNALTIELWDPTGYGMARWMLDADHTAYNSGTGTWAARYTAAGISGGNMEMHGPGLVPEASGLGMPSFDGDGATEGGLLTNSALWNDFLDVALAGGTKAGSIALIFKSTNTDALTLPTTYNNPLAIGNAGGATLSVGFGNDSGTPSVHGHFYDSVGGAHKAQAVPAAANAFHAVVMRWNASACDLSVDGGLPASASYATMALSGGSNPGFLGNRIYLGISYDGSSPSRQIFAGAIAVVCLLDNRVSNSFLTRFNQFRLVKGWN